MSDELWLSLAHPGMAFSVNAVEPSCPRPEKVHPAGAGEKYRAIAPEILLDSENNEKTASH